MKKTIGDFLKKLDEIDQAIDLVSRNMPTNEYTSFGPREEVVVLLEEYAEMIKNIKIDI